MRHIETAAAAAVQQSLSRFRGTEVVHGTVVELFTGGYGIHDILLGGDIDPVPAVDVTTGTPLSVGDRVSVMFAPPHQALIFGRVTQTSDWQPYVPEFQNWTNEALLIKRGRYTRTGNTVVVEGGIEVPVGTNLAGTLRFSLPLPAHESADVTRWLFGGRLLNGDNNSRYASIGIVNPAADPNFVTNFFTTTTTSVWGFGIPGSWGDGTSFDFFGTYETANDSP